MPPTEARPLRWAAVVLVLLGGDIITGYLSLVGAYTFRFRADLLPAVTPINSYYPPAMLAVLLACFAWKGLYRERYATVGGLDEYRRIGEATLVSGVLIVVVAYLLNETTISRAFLIATLVLTTVLVSVNRFAVRRIVQAWRTRGLAVRRVLIIGANAQGVELARDLLRTPAASATVCGFLDEYRPVGADVQGFTVLGDPMDVARVADQTGATHVVVVNSALSWEAMQYTVEYLHGAPRAHVVFAPGTHAVDASPLQLVQLGPVLLLSPELSRIVGLEAVLKRTFELAVVTPAFVLTLPFQAGLALWLLARGRPALMTMNVLGPHGRTFDMPYFPVGGWLRSRHLSRLPALWLIIIGRLSLVGPRPIRLDERHEYERHLPVLNALKPGFIGPWWLVRQGRPVSVAEEISFDLQYARRYTFWMDVRVLVRVASSLVSRRPPAPAPDRVQAQAVSDHL